MRSKRHNIESIRRKLEDLNKQRYYETTCPVGVAYHELPFREFKGPVYRRDLKQRADLITNHLAIRGLKGIDIGCAIGGVSFELARRGALMFGSDFNPEEIAIAQSLENVYRTGCFFQCEESLETIRRSSFLANFDFAVWFSQWMWLVKLHGFEKGMEALFLVSKSVDHLFFETSIGDAAAGDVMRDHGITTPEAVYGLLRANTIYTKIIECKRGDGTPLNRSVYYCCNPANTERKGLTTSVKRVNYNTCAKDVSRYPELFANEVQVLQRLSGRHFPSLQRAQAGVVNMSYCGEPLTCANMPDNYQEQCLEILRDLKKSDVIHRDINPNNLLVKHDVIMLVDYGYAARLSDLSSRELPNLTNKLPPKLGYSAFRGKREFDDEYSLHQSILFILNHSAHTSPWVFDDESPDAAGILSSSETLRGFMARMWMRLRRKIMALFCCRQTRPAKSVGPLAKTERRYS